MRLCVVVLVLSGWMAAVAAWADSPLAIRDAASLATALKAPGAGVTLVLAPGEYGALALSGMVGLPGAPLTIRSADARNPASFSRMDIQSSENIVLEYLTFDYRFRRGDSLYSRPFRIGQSRNVTLRHVLFDGDVARGVSSVDDGFGYAFGLSIRNLTGFTLERSEIRNFYRGLAVSRSRDIRILGNDLHDIRMDGMDFAQVQHVLIAGNHIHGFNRSLASADHADMIQFWTAGTDAATRDVVIRGNILNSERGYWTQSIFMRNELVDRGRASTAMFYRDITIDNNVIINAHTHGITVGETASLVIANNTLIRNALSEGAKVNDMLWTPRIRVASASRNVRITQNAVEAIVGFQLQQDWVVSDNLLLSYRRADLPGYYDSVFMDARKGDPRHLSSFAYRPGGPLDSSSIGSTLLADPALR